MPPYNAHRMCVDDAKELRRKHVSPGVLLVEDSPSSQMAFTELLQVLDFTLLAILGRESAATEWLETHPDEAEIVVLDLLLLDGSGFNLIDRARQQQPRAKVIVFSSYATPAVAEKCLRLGADAVFRKSEVAELTSYLEALSGGGGLQAGELPS
jgi:two-component system, OmpR family, response regulator